MTLRAQRRREDKARVKAARFQEQAALRWVKYEHQKNFPLASAYEAFVLSTALDNMPLGSYMLRGEDDGSYTLAFKNNLLLDIVSQAFEEFRHGSEAPVE